MEKLNSKLSSGVLSGQPSSPSIWAEDNISRNGVDSTAQDIVELFIAKSRCGRAAPSTFNELTLLDSNKIKKNQDAFVVKKDLCGEKGTWMFGILDGHGSDGHHVSAFIKQKIVEEFEIEMAMIHNKNKNKIIFGDINKELLKSESKTDQESRITGSRESEQITMPSINNKSFRNRNINMSKLINSIEINKPFNALDSSSDKTNSCAITSPEVRTQDRKKRSKSKLLTDRLIGKIKPVIY